MLIIKKAYIRTEYRDLLLNYKVSQNTGENIDQIKSIFLLVVFVFNLLVRPNSKIVRKDSKSPMRL